MITATTLSCTCIIAHGIAIGFIGSAAIQLPAHRTKGLPPTVAVFARLFVLKSVLL